MSLKNIIPISALKDNYIWTLFDETKRHAWIVDPGEADPVIDTLDKMDCKLGGILITHHHGDHTAGIPALLNHFGDVAVYANYQSPNQYITHRLKEGDEIECLSMKFRAIEIPGHTLDHMAYYGNEVLFSGDTLFSAGCGRIFEGTPKQMFASLQKLMQLPDETNIYCGHEYTLANLLFASKVEPTNKNILEKIAEVKIMMEKNGCTLPSQLGQEKMFNPFLRCHVPEVVDAVTAYSGKIMDNEVDVFAHLREWKNR